MQRNVKCCRVVHVTTVHNALDVRIFYKELKSLARAGYAVSLIAQHFRDESVDGIPVLALPKPRNRMNRFFGVARQTLCLAHRQQADVYHFHDPELLLIGLLLKLLEPRRICLYDAHEDVPKDILSKDWVHPRLRSSLAITAAIIEWAAARLLDGFVAATPSIARRFPQMKTVVIQNYPIWEDFQSILFTPYTERPRYIVYVGGITPIRGAFEMVRAMERLPPYLNARLLLVGEFTPAALEKELRAHAGWATVEYLGWRPRTEVIQLLGRARIGLVLFQPVPNHIEAQPNKLFEYMAAGLPVVVSDFPFWRQIVERHQCGLLVNPADHQTIAEAIQWLLEHPAEAQIMGQRGQEAVSKYFHWQSEAAKLIDFYERLGCKTL